jgi:pyruvate dehydrogenase E1 component beta subunit
MSNKYTVRQALNEAMAEEMRLDDKVFIIGEEVAEYNGAYKVTQGLFNEFGGKRVIDAPITEHGFTGLAVGAAMSGLRPIVEFMTFNFGMQAIDQIINSAAKTKYMSGGKVSCPIVFRGPNGAASGVGAQHAQCFASWYSHCPGLIVMSPYSAEDAKGLLKSAIKSDSPVVFLEHELVYGNEFEINNHDPIEIGKAKVVKEGKDITITSFSYMMKFVIEAANILEEQGISVEVIDLRTLRPLDTATIFNSVKKTNRLLCVEEGWPYASISSEIISLVNENIFDYLDAEPLKLCGKDVPMPYADTLEKATLPSVEEIIATVKKLV